MLPHDNYLETAASNFQKVAAGLRQTDPMYILAVGLMQMAQGILYMHQTMERRLTALEGRPPRQ